MILALLVGLFVVVVGVADWAALRKQHPRALAIELIGFAAVLLLVFKAEWFHRFARELGIQRGVDMVIYPMVVWLFREAILGRVRYQRNQRDITRLVRQLAIQDREVYVPKQDTKDSNLPPTLPTSTQ